LVLRANVAIAVADEDRDRIFEVAATCRALGLDHKSTLTDIGVLLGSLELDNLLRVRAVPGVVAVEIERDSRIKDAFEERYRRSEALIKAR
jgi:hypothetical protein